MRAGSMTSPACAPHIGQPAHLSPLRRLLVTLWAQPMSNFNLNLRPLLFDSAQSLEAPSVQELPRARSVEIRMRTPLASHAPYIAPAPEIR
jgi:hypothetical protein